MATELTAPIIKKGVVIDGITGTFGSVIDAVVFFGYDNNYPYINISNQVNVTIANASTAGKQISVTISPSGIDEVKVYCMPFRHSDASITSFTANQAVGTFETLDTGYLLTLNTAGYTSCTFRMSTSQQAWTAFIICHN